LQYLYSDTIDIALLHELKDKDTILAELQSIAVSYKLGRLSAVCQAAVDICTSEESHVNLYVEFPSTIEEDFKNLPNYSQEKIDLLMDDGTRFAVPTLLLTAHSDYFYKMLHSGMTEAVSSIHWNKRR
jgi:hypothetical protein